MSSVSGRPSHFRLLIKHQLGRRFQHSQHPRGFREKQRKNEMEGRSQFLHLPELCLHGMVPRLYFKGYEFPQHHLFKSHFKWIYIYFLDFPFSQSLT